MSKVILDKFFNIYKNKRLLIFLFFLSLFFSLIFLLLFKNIGPPQHRIPGTDYLTIYKPVANNILGGRGITKEGKLSIITPPGYPIILSMIFGLSYFLEIPELKLIVIFNVLVVAITCCFLFLVSKLLFNKKIALISVFLWMLYPFNLWLIKNPNTEVPFILFLYLGIYLYILALKKGNWKHIFLAGISFGFTSLIRPISLLLSFLLALLFLFLAKDIFKRKRFFLAVILLIGSILTILPWELYVFVQNGEIIPLSILGPRAFKAGFTFALRKGAGGDEVVVPVDVRALMKRAEAKNFSGGYDIIYFCLKELINRPIPFLKLLGLKILRTWYATSQKWYETLILAIQAPYLLSAFAGLISAIKIYRKKKRNVILLLGIIFYFWIMTIYAHSILRYMIPVMGLVVIFSAITINILITKLTKKLNPAQDGDFGFNNNSL